MQAITFMSDNIEVLTVVLKQDSTMKFQPAANSLSVMDVNDGFLLIKMSDLIESFEVVKIENRYIKSRKFNSSNFWKIGSKVSKNGIRIDVANTQDIYGLDVEIARLYNVEMDEVDMYLVKD